MGWPPGTGQGECTSLPGFSPMSLLYLQRLAQRLGHVGAHYTSVEGVHLSVSTPHPQQVPIFPEAGTFSLATPPMTKDRLLGLSASKFTCLKKKKSHSSFLHGGRFCSPFGSTADRMAGLGNGLSLWAQNRPGPVSDSSFTHQPVESSYRGSSVLFWNIKNTLNIHEVSDKICT